ncbi:splicing factor 45 [Geosmithia morbida]|uniref:Splicing factor 45 n=1 Tax=Geosmithia morbida TaxID=1094350 RepID=A0A9P4YSY4_9HYPO|nr:splicing factor 45 [Geosmithia morbida]KAF4121076.1 splicing factor 45 [Geosmithia morbida]
MGPPPPPRGLSLYDNLTDPNETPSDSATISSAPVLYSSDQAKKPVDPALRFQPIRRPQPKQGSKAIPGGPRPTPKPAPPATTAAPPPPPSAVAGAAPPSKSSLADWAATEEDEWLYGTGEKRQRGGRKRKKKNRQDDAAFVETDWDDIYDPARPTNIDEYLHSDEKVEEVREWRALLYRHRRRDVDPDSDLSSDDGNRPAPKNQFAPPPSYNFAPPPVSPPPPPPSELQHPPPSTATISAAPIRYTQPEEASTQQADQDNTSGGGEEAARSNLPGQSGFAARLMSKYGWTAGTGLGADSSGIVNPLRVKVDKRRRRADADGGGWAEPAGKGKIIGGTAAHGRRPDDGGSRMSEVIVLRNMLWGMDDLQAEIEDGLGQEIGEECGEKYGRVERLYIDQENRQVFIKFTNQVSALRFDEGVYS